ncbi:FeoA family protein [Palaeococcus pacificus DY20341]|uniref:FeoA family protein n=2 Tax=Palaeococcus TaxID=83867 RepID=A0A075LYG2_9EURY|nr:FeoA family protein [Palaeococcus pacificus]AIF69613.1 FeoA family protein [Palaeococcus pacificus DY20341]
MYVRLTQMREGEKGVVVDIQGGIGVRQKLIGMGITPGARIVVIKSGKPGPFIIAIGNMRLALGRGVADRILLRREA